jgi:hypothetical protein
MRRFFLLSVLAVGCGSTGGPTEPTAPITKDEAAAASEGAADSGIDYCARYGWYDDAECDGFCVLPDPDCGGEAARCSKAARGSRCRS